MFDWVLGGLGDLFGFIGDAVGEAVGWAWEKVIKGIYQWLANGLALLIEWVWSVLDSGTTPRVTAGWFRNELAARMGVIALAVTVAMMLAAASQAALAGRPEQIFDTIKESIKSVAASALTITVIDVLIGVTDEAAGMVWQVGRADLVQMIEGMVTVATLSAPLAVTFVGPLCMLFGFIGLIGLVVSLMMRSALIYVVAALAPLVWSIGVLPSFRGSSRRLVHLIFSLVVSKLAIVITLVVAVKLIANAGGEPEAGSVINDGAAAVGTLMAGFICFLIAAVTPMVLYRLMPAIEGAAVGSGIASGWVRGATTAAHTGLMIKNIAGAAGGNAATRPIANQTGDRTHNGGPSGPTGAAAGQTGGSSRAESASRQAATQPTSKSARPDQRPRPQIHSPGPGGQTPSTAPSRPTSTTPTSTTEDDDGQVRQ